LSKIEIPGENVINLFVPYKEVPGYLCAADIGIIWRSNDIVNNVASPVKFSEYVCCGLPVIANNGVKLITKYIKETGFGQIVNDFTEIDAKLLASVTSLDRNAISEYGESVFSSRVIARSYLKIYQDMLLY
jgi:glycosyltransferase involved in cell wall biosynthesis